MKPSSEQEQIQDKSFEFAQSIFAATRYVISSQQVRTTLVPKLVLTSPRRRWSRALGSNAETILTDVMLTSHWLRLIWPSRKNALLLLTSGTHSHLA